MRSVRGKLVSGQILYSTLTTEEGTALEDGWVRLKIHTAAVKRPNYEVLKFLSAGDDAFVVPGCTELCGEVIQVGPAVTRFAIGDVACGVVSPLSAASACADMCDIHELDIVKVPSARTNTDAVACLGPAIRAYTAMIYHANVTSGTTVVIMSGASANGLIAIQLALAWGAKVIATVCGDDERGFLEKNYPNIAQILDIGSRNSSLVSSVMEETGSLGANVIIDDGVTMYPDDTHESSVVGQPSKHDVISCLAVNGKWVTSQANLQLDPPDSMLLYMRNASISYQFEHAWNASRAQQGRYMHMLTDIMYKLASGIIKAHVSRTVQFVDAESVLSTLPERQIGSTVMYMN